jgi:hypothetical protein
MLWIAIHPPSIAEVKNERNLCSPRMPSLCGQGQLYFTLTAFWSTAPRFAWISGCLFLHISTVKDDDWGELYIKHAPRSKHYISLIQISQLMLYREIIALYSQIHTNHIYTVCTERRSAEMLKLAVHIVTTGRWRVNFSYTTVARCQVLVALFLRIQAFWDVTMCAWLWPLDPWRWRQYVPSKHRWPPSQRHSMLTQKVS